MYETSKAPRKENPRDTAGVFSLFTFFYALDMFEKSKRKELEEEDVYQTAKKCRAETLGNILESKWRVELKNGGRSLSKVLLKLFGLEYLYYGCLNLVIKTPTTIVIPYATGILVSYFASNSSTTQQQAILAGAVIVMAGTIKSIYLNFYHFVLTRLSLQIEMALSSLIYRKSLKLTESSLNKVSSGRIVTLLIQDAIAAYAASFVFLHDLWTGMVELLLTFAVVYYRIGGSALLGIAFFISVLPIQVYFGTRVKQLSLKTLAVTDERLRRIQEVLTSMRLIKMFTWECYFTRVVRNLRKKELKILRRNLLTKATMFVLSILSFRVSYFLSIFAYYILGNDISAEELFFLVSCYKSMEGLLSYSIPGQIAQLAQGKSAIERLQKFYLMEEMDDLNKKPEQDKMVEERNLFISDDSNKKPEEDKSVEKRSLFLSDDSNKKPEENKGVEKQDLVLSGDLNKKLKQDKNVEEESLFLSNDSNKKLEEDRGVEKQGLFLSSYSNKKPKQEKGAEEQSSFSSDDLNKKSEQEKSVVEQSLVLPVELNKKLDQGKSVKEKNLFLSDDSNKKPEQHNTVEEQNLFLTKQEIEKIKGYKYSKARLNLILSEETPLKKTEAGITIKNLVLKNADSTIFNNVNLNLTQPSLIGITGAVGCGKTSLLKLLLQEIQPDSGELSINGEISYASQEPWLFPSTIRQNILFGNPFNPKRYHQVLKICALIKDLRELPEKDLTVILDKGVNLSGGQKARINLARAVYRKADVYLLDDVFSSLDLNVGKDIFRNCIRGFLKDSICLFICQNEVYLKTADKVVTIANNKLEVVSNYENNFNNSNDGNNFKDENDFNNGNDLNKVNAGNNLNDSSGRNNLSDSNAGNNVNDSNGRNNLDDFNGRNKLNDSDGGNNLNDSNDINNLKDCNVGNNLNNENNLNEFNVGNNLNNSIDDNSLKQSDGGNNFNDENNSNDSNSGNNFNHKNTLNDSNDENNLNDSKDNNLNKSNVEINLNTSIYKNNSNDLNHENNFNGENILLNPSTDGNTLNYLKESNSDADADCTFYLNENPPFIKLYKEYKVPGKVLWKDYRKCFELAGGYAIITIIVAILLVGECIGLGFDYYAEAWLEVQAKVINATLNANNETTSSDFEDLALERRNVMIYYALLLFATIFFLGMQHFTFIVMMVRAARNLHWYVFERIMGATMHFFNAHFAGSIVNRFSKDVALIDELLGYQFFESIKSSFDLIITLGMICYLNGMLLIPSLILIVVVFYTTSRYLRLSRSLRRLEPIVRAPCVGYLNTTLEGLVTIRAAGNEKQLIGQFERHQDVYSSVVFMYNVGKFSFGLWVDILGQLFQICLIFSFIYFYKKLENIAGDVGVAATQAMGISSILKSCFSSWVETENAMTATERVLEYAEAEQEDTKGETPEEWPQNNNIEFNCVSLTYPNSHSKILNDINFKIPPKAKIGIIGRTGAGKSSIISALFRLYQPDGAIKISDFITSELNLKYLRSKISIIPQDPILFKGTIRSNLDPENLYPDQSLWNSLEKVGLKKIIKLLGLSSEVEEGGLNFSLGQRQLFNLARVVLSNNKIIVFDEAAANLDEETEEITRNLIDILFADCTLLIIAHRLKSVVGCDRIMVVDAGRIVEFDSPEVMLKNKNSYINTKLRLTS